MSRGYFFPQLRSVGFNSVTGEPATFEGEDVTQVEVGVKFVGERLYGSANIFWNELTIGRTSTSSTTAWAASSSRRRRRITETTGIEVDGTGSSPTG